MTPRPSARATRWRPACANRCAWPPPACSGTAPPWRPAPPAPPTGPAHAPAPRRAARSEARERRPDHAGAGGHQQQAQAERCGVFIARMAVLVVFVRPLVAVAVGDENDAIGDQVRQRVQPVRHQPLRVRPQPGRDLPGRQRAVDRRADQRGALRVLSAGIGRDGGRRGRRHGRKRRTREQARGHCATQPRRHGAAPPYVPSARIRVFR